MFQALTHLSRRLYSFVNSPHQIFWLLAPFLFSLLLFISTSFFVQVDNKTDGPFDEEDVKVLRAIASQLGVAIVLNI